MKKKLSTKKILIITAVFLVAVIGSSYAFFTLTITGEGAPIEVDAGFKELTVSNSDDVTFNTIVPGFSETITYSVTNTGNTSTYYNLVWKDLTNEFTRSNDLTYTISSENNGGNADNIVVPASGSNISIFNDVKIEAGVTQTYTITFNYAKLMDVDQSVDMNKSLSGHLAITASKKED